jgi:hypothetical protein
MGNALTVYTIKCFRQKCQSHEKHNPAKIIVNYWTHTHIHGIGLHTYEQPCSACMRHAVKKKPVDYHNYALTVYTIKCILQKFQSHCFITLKNRILDPTLKIVPLSPRKDYCPFLDTHISMA